MNALISQIKFTLYNKNSKPPSKPINIKITDLTSRSFTVSWTPHKSALYYIIKLEGKTNTVPNEITTFSFNELKPNTAYTLIIEGFNDYGSAKSKPIKIQTNSEKFHYHGCICDTCTDKQRNTLCRCGICMISHRNSRSLFSVKNKPLKHI